MRLISPQHRPRYRNEIAALKKFAEELVAPAGALGKVSRA
jgi:hypothetical protein